jgi:teichoic acid transport system ATP-binding protein
MHDDDLLFKGRSPARKASPTKPVVLKATDVHVRYRIRMARGRRPGTTRRSDAAKAPQELHAVRGVSVQLREGDCLGIVGDNGAGKSSLLRALGGFEPLASGAVLAASAPRLLTVGGATRPSWTGLETIEAGLRALRVPLSQRRYLTQDIVDFTGLGDHLESPVSTYSRGMQGRLQFALNTAVPAQILCIDEGLGGADGRYRVKAQQRIDFMLGNSGAMVLVSHSLATIKRLATHAVWLHEGRIVHEGRPDEVIEIYERYLNAPQS